MARLPLALLFALLLALSAASAAPASSPAHRIFLPAVQAGAPRGQLGVELSWISPERGVRELGAGWVRRNGLSWGDVEPMPGGGYRWDAPRVRELETQLAAASRLGLRVILVVHGSPSWAVAPHQANCAPIAPQHYDDYARFVAAAVQRYSATPFTVRYWELGNEPDAFIFAADAPFGCWGRSEEPLYGGEAYGELLKVAYPAIKAADPTALVLNGGLLLERPYMPANETSRSGRFLEGMLAVGAGDAFDILAYHSYSHFDGTADGGLARDWKPAYIRAILDRFGLEKPLLVTEGALLCTKASTACAEAQAHAFGRLYARALRDNLLGFVWYLYDNDGFHNTALVEPADPTLQRAAYRAFAYAETMLGSRTYVGSVDGLPPGVEAHRLAGGQRSLIVLWANTPSAVRLALEPGAVPTCTEWDGAPLPCVVDTAGELSLEAVPGPRYIIWTP